MTLHLKLISIAVLIGLVATIAISALATWLMPGVISAEGPVTAAIAGGVAGIVYNLLLARERRQR